VTAGVNVVLLPGLDGTGRLFDRFEQAAPNVKSVRRVALPPDRVLTYDELAQWVLPALPSEPFVLIGESFSGPLALRLTRSVQPVAVVLCASFVRASALARLAAVPLSFCLRIAPPKSAVSALMAGGDAELANDLVRAIASVDKAVLSARARMVLEADARADLAAFPGRVLYLQATRDLLVGNGQADLVRQTSQDSRVAEVDGPHLLLQARPVDCWRQITMTLGEKPLS